MTRLLKFFLISKLHAGHAVVVIAACVGLGVWTLSYNPAELDNALGLLLVVQMFLASTGFTSRAFVGHFDPVLLAGESRGHAAAAHWLASISPGVLGWLVLVTVGFALGSPDALSAACGRRAVALMIVSNLSWIAGYRLPRGAAGVLWLTVLVAILLQRDLRALSMTINHGIQAWPWDSAVLLACPFVLIGNKPEIPPAVLAISALLSVLAAAVVAGTTARLNVLLAERG